MLGSSGPFEAYREIGGEGRSGIGSIVAGAVLLVICLLACAIAVVLLAAVAIRAGILPNGPLSSVGLLENTMAGQHGLFVSLSMVATLWPAVWLSLRVVQRRSLGGVLGFERRLRLPEFHRGFIAAVVVSLLCFPVWVAIDPEIHRTEMSVGQWLAWLGPVALAILFQASGEELAFRGYLVQILAKRFRSPWIWAALPALAFTLCHWNADAGTRMNASIFVAIGAFAIAMTLLTVGSGSLAAPMGVHFGFNLVAMPFISIEEDGPGSFGLWWSRPLSDPAWTTGEVALIGAVGIFEAAAVLALLFHRKSPVRLPEPAPPPVADAGPAGRAAGPPAVSIGADSS